MKKLLFAVSALAALSLLAPSVGFAQTAHNQLGMYIDQVGTPTAANIDVAINTPFNVFLVLTNPVNETFNEGVDTQVPITSVDGFEAAIVLPTAATFFVLAENYPAPEINVGSAPDYIVGFSNSVPVVDNAVVLVSWQFMTLDPAALDVFMDATATARFPGKMAVVDAGDNTTTPGQPIYPSTGDFANKVFSINGTPPVATENESWGGVKALFR